MSSPQPRQDRRHPTVRTASGSASAPLPAVRHLHPRGVSTIDHRECGHEPGAPLPVGRRAAVHHDAVDIAIERLQAGQMVIVVDDPERENEGDLVMAAQFVSAPNMAFMVRHTTGIICAPMTDERADALGLPLMVTASTDPHGTAFTVSVDAEGTGTGVSAQDRAATVAALAAATTTSSDLRIPGHIFPLRARAGGVLERGGHTEAAVDLMRLAGLDEVGVISELVADDGDMLRGQALMQFAADHHLAVVSIAELKARRSQQRVRLSGTSQLPTAYGLFEARSYREGPTGQEHLVLIAGELDALRATAAGALVRVHSECLTGDLASSLRCDCGDQLRESLQLVADNGGIVIYLRGHEGRGIGLSDKLRAYTLQDAGRDTVDANLDLGLPVDSRDYAAAADILTDLDVPRIRLISNNPAKRDGLSRHGIQVTECLHLPSHRTAHNVDYLRTKRDRMGHAIDI
ncbi:3,4-dihydroxy-2-butanone-4-phosphate synthase [Mycolicibacterium fortuitum subsp. fortuitum]|uniref:GTP cyclohydrolase-2 n=1 Tax=Mycolicibacterium fortuitum TaxID=1766 RepID=A0A378V0A9_MYCFO|nr:3,4-dihydroxy-2-butanone-4-phosphate synthase [Mycolicibacterium fortuitum]CRL57464.1 bifunctional 3,4-dihydroxy-2-butanone 4-phosphate synthase/GTP cyclohydrolase II protein [Mycolicibacterium fortuitum subsp. fortuitum DSM 46621 = ATCC 6841 = JCM 6387]CRL80731.1 bifunctional 3,4-dihydroxy-2-butanone 4-phosphate synthase/GTP cyclohydrolase II protein [Mycolicibacter nonchromogenicus]MCA4756765.1 3,4-dihydroxy-2-butanone-4-phosphate synthase [Mycolicibacterium fortuitum]MDG5770547.1 3,4-dihy